MIFSLALGDWQNLSVDVRSVKLHVPGSKTAQQELSTSADPAGQQDWRPPDGQDWATIILEGEAPAEPFTFKHGVNIH